jgi:hypothetical protein
MPVSYLSGADRISSPHKADLDIHSAADIIRRDGADATIQAAGLIDLMLEHGGLDGQRVWLRIKQAIIVLQAPSADTVH